MSTIDFRGHEVFYAHAGAGEPIVFLHNGGSSHRIWTPQIEHFAKTHHVLAPDLLGFGRSAKPELDYTLGLYADLLDEFVDQLDLDAVTIVGNCIGSATALAYAARRPERVRRVVAINVLTRATITKGISGPLVRLALRNRPLARALSRIPLPTAVARAIVAAQLRDPDRVQPQTLAHLCELYRDPDQLRVLVNLAMNMDSFGVLDHATDVTSGVPVLVVQAEDNRIVPAKAVRRLCTALRPAGAATVPGGHLPMLERPEAVNAAIQRFISSPPGASPPCEPR